MNEFLGDDRPLRLEETGDASSSTELEQIAGLLTTIPRATSILSIYHQGAGG